jgi:hypothetical protein
VSAPNTPPLIRLTVSAAGEGHYGVTATDSGAVLVDRSPSPLRSAAAACRVLGYGPAVLLEFVLPISTILQLKEPA